MNVLELFKPITTFIFDMDGVLTDGQVLSLPGDSMIRSMNVKDGYALSLAVKNGYHVAIISGGKAPEAEERLQYLGIKHIFMQVHNKLECMTKFLVERNLTAQEVLFMGDDIPDGAAMAQVKLPCCPADAVAEIKNISKYISPFKGGKGCARDVIEKVMKLQDKWHNDFYVRSQ
jgi:3-deoxy-D-manno-octulosonate 8-phosphate phosphatase (KDO 8-P phosphatase)